MGKVSIKILTVLLSILWANLSLGQVLNQEEFSTHLRWNLYIPEDQVKLEKKSGELVIRTLNIDLFEKVKLDLQKATNQPKYFESVAVNNSDENGVASITVKLKNSDVELFSFYRERDKKYVFDFWIDADAVNARKAGIAKTPVLLTPAKIDISKVPLIKKPKVVAPKAIPVKIEPVVSVPVEKKEDHRDYRYGAPFIWNYEPLSPELVKSINLERKTPEYFYPIEDRKFEESEKEAHLQLCINLYKKKKWGLMYKSIKLFKEKYGDLDNEDLLEYLKANALLRNNFENGERNPEKMAINIYKNISERTKNYELQKAIIKYLINYAISNKELIKSLQESKRLYVVSKENFDIEESRYAAEAILFNFANLNQIDKIREFIADKTIQKLLPTQISLSYEIYSLLKLEREDEVIDLYKKNKNAMAKPVEATILYNVAEAYFRNGEFEEAIKLFDEFLSNYSHMSYSGRARVRIALSYEILNKDFNEVEQLYKNAINRTVGADVAFEAKIRYVALLNLRKKEVSDKDREARVFIDLPDKNISADLKKSLWLTRLRLFIVDGEFEKALAYLNAIPINTMKPSELRVFESDGAEIIYGLISQNFQNSHPSQVIKLWEVYKDRYISKVARDPYLQYVVAQSYLKLDIIEGFEKIYERFSATQNSPARTYPEWIERDESIDSKNLISLLDIIRNIKVKNIEVAERKVNELIQKDSTFNKAYYFKGMIEHQKKNYKEAAVNFEKYLANVKSQTIFDPYEIGEMITKYTESLYELGEFDKYKKVAKAILQDTQKYSPTNMYMHKLRERLSYISIEISASEKKDSSQLLLESEIAGFLRVYKDSIYEGRVKYLLGIAYLNNSKEKEANEIFSGLLVNDKISDYIKELVRSEISLMKIKERTI